MVEVAILYNTVEVKPTDAALHQITTAAGESLRFLAENSDRDHLLGVHSNSTFLDYLAEFTSGYCGTISREVARRLTLNAADQFEYIGLLELRAAEGNIHPAGVLLHAGVITCDAYPLSLPSNYRWSFYSPANLRPQHIDWNGAISPEGNYNRLTTIISAPSQSALLDEVIRLEGRYFIAYSELRVLEFHSSGKVPIIRQGQI